MTRCPRCGQSAIIRWSAPPGSPRHGNPIAYPCTHWLSPKQVTGEASPQRLPLGTPDGGHP